MRMVCFLKVVGECGNVTKMQQAYQKLVHVLRFMVMRRKQQNRFYKFWGSTLVCVKGTPHCKTHVVVSVCAQLCSCSNPIYEVDKSNNILPSATAGCHYAEFLIYSSKSLSVKVQFTREDDNKGKRRVK